MAGPDTDYSTVRTVHHQHYTTYQSSFFHHPATSTHAIPTAHPASTPIHHTPTYNPIAGAATQPPTHPSHPSPTGASSGSSTTGFAYPTPTSVPQSSGAIIGLAITIALLLVFLCLGGVLWFMRRRANGQSQEGDSHKLEALEERPGSALSPSVYPEEAPPATPQWPGKVARASGKVRTWYGRRVPSGWI